LAFLYQQLNTFHTPPMAAVATAITTARHDPAALRGLSLPILWITSSDDALFPSELVADAAAQVGARCEVIAGAGHSSYFERPGVWNRVLLEFLASI
jgi:3-oxoadipate enol-lactonase